MSKIFKYLLTLFILLIVGSIYMKLDITTALGVALAGDLFLIECYLLYKLIKLL